MKDKKWIQKAVEHKGALKKELGISSKKTIPEKTLKAAAKKKGILGKRARLAETLKSFNK